jgi:hypothetical protein
MFAKPFARLTTQRAVDRPELPSDLAMFYMWHEGVGLESDHVNYSVRLCALEEVDRVGWDGLEVVADVPEGWEKFAAIRIGMGVYFETIVYVLAAPSCPPGSILAIGTMCGPAGDGPFMLDSALVLASSFTDWLIHLERWGWAEPAIATDWDLTEQEQEQNYKYYLALNPKLYTGDR